MPQQLFLPTDEVLRRPVAGAQVVVWLARSAVVVDAGVIEQDVDRDALEPLGECLHLFDVGDVHLLDAQERLVLGGELGQRGWDVRPAMGGDDGPAFRQILLREFKTDP